MNWTKIPTNLLISRTPDNELVAIVKYQLLWADLEYQPTDEIALRYMSNKQLASVKQYLNDIEAQVVADINSTVKHRGGQKTYYKKKQSLKQNTDGQCDNQYDSQCDNHTDGADKIRLDKIRKEKEISDDISKKKPIDFDTPLKHEEPKKQEKKSYGEQHKVKLTDEEYSKLKCLYGDYMDFAIDLLDRYLAQNNKKYASHYAVMRMGNWVYTETTRKKLNEERGF